MTPPEFHRLAEHELNEAVRYYDLEDPGIGAVFLVEVDRCLQSIQAAPEAGAILRGFAERFVADFSVGFPTRSSTGSSRMASGFSR